MRQLRSGAPTTNSISKHQIDKNIGEKGGSASLRSTCPARVKSRESRFGHPLPGQNFAQFGAGCFWSVELAYQRVPGVTKTEVGYTQGILDSPTYHDVCSGSTKHSEVVRVQYDPKECSFETLLDVFWSKHNPTTLNRQIPYLMLNYFSIFPSKRFSLERVQLAI
ncbi:hypothetical protein IFM89_027012 [Coptis chinensis]|uniref:peptide-methionine (S)-S-oxide reductase n=1 Tax=Coptis chinensis TaxID=261450 RepID=A0A835LVK4_9MAGN|nr:hypothetical protein IFM89_027012 [Coptis chinensis]